MRLPASARDSVSAGGSIWRRGPRGQFSAQADPAGAVAADPELSQVEGRGVPVGEHLRGRSGDVGEAAEVDSGVLVVEVVQEQHGAGRVVGAVREYAGRDGDVDVRTGAGVD